MTLRHAEAQGGYTTRIREILIRELDKGRTKVSIRKGSFLSSEGRHYIVPLPTDFICAVLIDQNFRAGIRS